MTFLHWMHQGIFNLSKPFHKLKDKPVLYRGEHFNIVNFGIFAALDGIMILVVFLFYLFMVQGQLPPDLMRMTFLLPVFVWSGAKLFFWGAQGVHFLRNPKEYVRQTGFYVGEASWGALHGLLW